MKKITILLLSLMCLKMSAQITTYNINKNFNCSDTLQPFGIQTHSYGLSIDGEGQLLSDTAFIRVVLVDDNENEWLVYERNSLYSTEKNSQFQGAAFETAALYKIVPCSLIVTLCDAAFYLANIKNNCTYTNKNEVTSVSDSVFLSKNLQIVERINAKLSDHKKAWRADTTYLSNLRYRDKKAMFGNDLPNLQGWDYYAYGYYSPLNDTTPPASNNIVKEFDWRTRHGSQNSDSYYYNSDGSGWIPRRRYGQRAAECWAFTAQFTTEALVNLYFNRQINDELSVQDIISCSDAGTWDSGGSVKKALKYIAEEGIVGENCFHFYPRQTIPCESPYKCENPNEIVSISDRSEYFGGEDTIKTNLITKGALACRMKKWGHAMSMVGFGVVKAGDPILYGNFEEGNEHELVVDANSPDIGKPYYIFKQSYADYGYDRSPFCKVIIDANSHNTIMIGNETYTLFTYVDAFSVEVPISSLLYDGLGVACLDVDGDGYYNWGIGPKPATCPNCPDEEDCDDSSPLIGPYNEKYECMVMCNNYVYSSIPEYIIGETLWGSEKYLDHDVIIEDGGTLTIINTIYMGGSTKIIIKPGGKLILDYGALLTGLCDNMWQGIEVWGNSSTHQYETNGSYGQGYLEMRNGATIENAICAVELWRPGHYNTTGGIIHATDATFRNNAKSVHALRYSNYSYTNGKEMPYNSFFHNCSFSIDANYLGTTTFFKHVDMEHVNGISFLGCDFSVNRNVPGVSLWCMGIGAYEAGFTVNSYCENSNVLPCPDEYLIPSSFYGFHRGIHASNDGSAARMFTVRNSLFDNNTCGIYALNTDYATIVDNDFTVGCGSDCDFGIYADGLSAFCIEENTFHPRATNTGSPYGIVIVNSQGTNDIYRNSFANLRCGNVAVGDNKTSTSGLTYTCNTNSGNAIDFCVLKDGSIGDIASSQGSATLPAGNTFDGSLYHLYNDGNHLISYYYDVNEPSQKPVWTLLYGVSANDIQNSNRCLTHYGNGGSVVKSSSEKAALESDYLSAHATYSSLLQLYESRIDGGSTPAQVADINNATSSDMWRLRAQLLGLSPYVSGEVLTTAADRDDVFTDPVLFEILAANPDELKKDTLISYLENKDNPLPAYMVDLLRQIASGFTARTALQAQMAQYQHDYSLAAGDIVRSNLDDSIANPTELRTWLGNMGDIASDRMIVASYLQEGDSVHAFALANMLPALYGLQGNALADHADYMRLITLHQTLNRENRNVLGLTEAEALMVDSIATYGTGTSKAMAEAMLSEISDDYVMTYSCPTMPDDGDGGDRGIGNATNASMNEAMGFTVSLSPNPATTWTTVDYTLPAKTSKATVTIANTLGVSVVSTELDGSQGQKVLDLRGLADGVYVYTVCCGELIHTGKLVVTK